MFRTELVPKMFGVRFQGRRIRKHTLPTSEVNKKGGAQTQARIQAPDQSAMGPEVAFAFSLQAPGP
jgi:hypothetical protein